MSRIPLPAPEDVDGDVRAVFEALRKYEALRKHDMNEAQIVEMLGVMELFTGDNKFLDSLGVEVDF